jgi:hypothetical protein
MAIRVYECEASEYEALKKVLEYDPYLDKSLSEEALKKLQSDKAANVIFARQTYFIYNGAAIGLSPNMYYVYLKANDVFFPEAEERFKKEFKTVKRVDLETEQKVIALEAGEEEKGNYGVGLTFGG